MSHYNGGNLAACWLRGVIPGLNAIHYTFDWKVSQNVWISVCLIDLGFSLA